MTDKVAIAMLRRFAHSASVMGHWFANRVERQHPDATRDEHFIEMKRRLAELDECIKEMDDETSL